MQRAVSLNQLIFAFSKSLDLINERLYKHHRNVAYIALRIAGGNEEGQCIYTGTCYRCPAS